jgi:hypothetical protein
MNENFSCGKRCAHHEIVHRVQLSCISLKHYATTKRIHDP